MRINTLLALVLSISALSLNVQAHEGSHEKESEMKHSCMNHDKKDANGSEKKGEKCEHMDHSKMHHEEHQQQEQTLAPKEEPQHEHQH